MGFIDISKYIFTPAATFDLQGRCYTGETGVPCRIKVGPRRVLEVIVCPADLKVTLWQRTDDQLTYLPGEPVETGVDKDGVLTVDMVAFARKRFGKDNVTFCNSDTWRWYKTRPWSDTFLATEQGLATSHSSWLDINVTHSTLRFVPGALTLCGHSVRSISWESFDEDLSAQSQGLYPLTETLLQVPHKLTAEDFLLPLKTVDNLRDSSFNYVTITTDRGVYRLDAGVHSKVTVELADGRKQDACAPSPGLCALQQLAALVELMRAETPEAVEITLEDLRRLGWLSRNP